MPIKVIVAPLSGVEGGEASLETALSVGKHLDAHVEAYHVSLDSRESVAYLAEGMTSAMIQDIMKAVDKEGGDRAQRAHQQFEGACKRAGVSAGWERPSTARRWVSSGWGTSARPLHVAPADLV